MGLCNDIDVDSVLSVFYRAGLGLRVVPKTSGLGHVTHEVLGLAHMSACGVLLLFAIPKSSQPVQCSNCSLHPMKRFPRATHLLMQVFFGAVLLLGPSMYSLPSLH